MTLEQQVRAEFERRFGAAAALVARAPGRVNLIGEHTDYNDGFVLPMAITFAAYIALTPRPDQTVRLAALDFDGTTEFSLDALDNTPDDLWARYVKGVAWALRGAGLPLRGFDGVLAGDVPIGAGLSSSASVEMAVARAFASASDVTWDARQMAQLGQKTENEWIGVRSGIMDQMISAAGVEGHALLIDCRWLTYDPVPVPYGTCIVILDSATRRELVTSAYNERREQCEAAAKFFGVPALRDVTMRQLRGVSDMLDPLIYRRARHIITENDRTLHAAEAMRQGDAKTFGLLMNASHDSMRDDFEITRREIDLLVKYAQGDEACYGARMTGGGFGGCVVALVREESAQTFADAVMENYRTITGLQPAAYISRAAAGASVTA